jgi:hypothetical protein
MGLRKSWDLGVIAAVMASAAIGAASAGAQEDAGERPNTAVTARMSVTPAKAGTVARPQGVVVRGAVQVVSEPDFDPPIITGEDILFGEGFSYNGDRYPRCLKVVIDFQGPEACPRASIMGMASGTGRADTVTARMKVILFNAGAARLLAYTTVDHPARVRRTIVLSTQNLIGMWRRQSTFFVPENLQIVAGIPIQLNNLYFSLGGRPWAKDYITTTSCPDGGWRYMASLHYLYDELGETSGDDVTGTVACTS